MKDSTDNEFEIHDSGPVFLHLVERDLWKSHFPDKNIQVGKILGDKISNLRYQICNKFRNMYNNLMGYYFKKEYKIWCQNSDYINEYNMVLSLFDPKISKDCFITTITDKFICPACSDREKLVRSITQEGPIPNEYNNSINDFFPVLKLHPCNHSYHLHCAFQWAKGCITVNSDQGRSIFGYKCLRCNLIATRVYAFRGGQLLCDLTDRYDLFGLYDREEPTDISPKELNKKHQEFYRQINYDPNGIQCSFINDDYEKFQDFPQEVEFDDNYRKTLREKYNEYVLENQASSIVDEDDEYIQFVKVIFDVDHQPPPIAVKEEQGEDDDNSQVNNNTGTNNDTSPDETSDNNNVARTNNFSGAAVINIDDVDILDSNAIQVADDQQIIAFDGNANTNMTSQVGNVVLNRDNNDFVTFMVRDIQ